MKVLAIVLITVSFSSATEDFAYFNNYLVGTDAVHKTYEGLLKYCFENFGIFSADRPANVDAEYAESPQKVQETMIKEIARIFQKMFLFEKNEIAYAKVIVDGYRVVPYHNICHGLAVGLYSATLEISRLGKKEYEDKYISDNIRSLFLAGLLHDIGHPGYTNNYFNSLFGTEKSIQLFKIQEIGTITRQEINPENDLELRPVKYSVKTCKMAKVADKLFYKNMGKLLKELSGNDEFNFEKELESAAMFVDGNLIKYFTPVKDKKITQTPWALRMDWDSRVHESKLPLEFVEGHPALKVLCESAEIVHAIIAYILILNSKEKIDLDFVVASILGTHMGLGFAGLALRDFHHNYVHISDLLGNVSQTPALRMQIIEQLFFEFTTESLSQGVNFVGIDYIFDQNMNKAENKEKALQTKNDVAITEYISGANLSLESFVNGQKGFLKFLIRPYAEVLQKDNIMDYPGAVDGADNLLTRIDKMVAGMGLPEYNAASAGLENTVKSRNVLFRII